MPDPIAPRSPSLFRQRPRATGPCFPQLAPREAYLSPLSVAAAGKTLVVRARPGRELHNESTVATNDLARLLNRGMRPAGTRTCC